MADLYRQQAIEFCGSASFGNVGLHRSLPANFAIFSLVGLLCLLITFGIFGTYTRKATVQGFLVPDKGVLPSVAPIGGVITDIYVKEGESVKKGDPLFRIKPQRFVTGTTNVNENIANKIDEQRQNLASTLQQKSSYFSQEQRNLQAQLANTKYERQYLDESIFYVAKQIDAQQKQTQKYQELFARNYISEVDLNSAQQKLLLLKERHAVLKREAFQLDNKLKSLQQRLSNEEKIHNEDSAQIKRQILTLENQLLEAQSATEQTVVATESGLIGSVLRETSQYVMQGRKVLTLLPEGAELQARLLVPGESAGFLKLQQSVRIRMSSFPYQKFGVLSGKLINVSQDAIEPGAIEAPIKLAESVYVVDISLSTKDQAIKKEQLKAGMKLEADILLETRTLFQWLTSPLNTFSV